MRKGVREKGGERERERREEWRESIKERGGRREGE